MRKHGFLILLTLLWSAPALAAAPETVELEEVEISAPRDTTERITQTEMERKSANTLWDALRGASGVYQTQSTGRGEGVITIRGSSRYQVGMYIDGVPTATAYRNEWDYNNVLTYDLESIEISKGYSSPLLQNSGGMAGVINVRTSKPQKPFEFKLKYLNEFDRDMKNQGRTLGTTIGTRQDLFYLQGAFVFSEQDYFRLPSGFEAGRWEDGGKRENSDYRNRRYNLMAGFTPTENIDISVGYVRQQFEKGQPVNAAKDAPNFGAGGNQTRLWRWPEYETDRYYTNANFNIGEKGSLSFVAYYDKHKDATLDYTDLSFGAIDPGSSKQTYDQYTLGGHGVFQYAFTDAHKLGLSAGYRRLSHQERRYGGGVYGQDWMLWEEDKENYYDLGAEYTFKPIEPLALVFGVTYTRMEPDTSEYRRRTGAAGNYTYTWNTRADADGENLFDYQIGAFYNITKDHEVFLTLAHKSRVGTMRERFYSDSATGELLNPDLGPEYAFHYEAGYRGSLADWLRFNASVYYIDAKDKIIQTGGGSSGVTQKFENVDGARMYGLELGAEALLSRYVTLGASASFMEWDTDAEDKPNAAGSRRKNLTDAPKAVGSVYANISPLEKLSIIPELFMTSSFYSNSDPDAANNESPGFATVHLKATYDILDSLNVEIGVKNLLDKEYYYNYGFPLAGRSFFAGLTYRY